MKSFIISVACILGLSMAACAHTGHDGAAAGSDSSAVSIAGMPAAYISQEDFIRASEQTVNGVVSVKSFATPRQQQQYGNRYSADPFNDPFFDFFFGSPGRRQQAPQQAQPEQPRQRQIGLGSGVIISDDGYIVTNNHVIADAERLEVTLNDNRNFKASVVGADPTTDIALLRIEGAPADLHVIPMGDSERLHVGEWVLAVGNPFGFNSTVTAGIVSAKARSLGASNKGGNMSIESFIQTDAALNPGNSGGALVNLNGELIGINSAIYSNTGSYSGFSFAIPTSIVKKVMADIRQYGTVQRAMLGCSVVELDAKLAKEKGITAVKAGCLVKDVNDMSTAKELGLKEDDVITAINGVEVHNFAQLVEQISKFRPGDKISVTYCRDNKSYTKTGVLRNSQGNTAITKKGDFAELGCAFMKLSSETKQHLGISNGVQVQGLKGGAFRDAGVKDGFIITEINDVPVNNSDDVEYLYNQVMKDEDNEKVLFLKGVYPTGKKYYYAVNLESNE